jgi:DNA-binding GntR family transcriptional regulator
VPPWIASPSARNDDDRIDLTYDEHAQILRAVIRRRADEANRLLRSHIEASKAEVRKITLHRLFTARKPG